MKDYETEISKHLNGPIPLPEIDDEEEVAVDVYVHEAGDIA